MVSIGVKVDISETMRFLQVHLPRSINAAIAQALTRTATTARVSAIKAIREQTGLPPKFLRERLKIKAARTGSLTAEVLALKGAPNLINFGARQTKSGVSAKAWNKRKIYRSAFIGNNGRTVFSRVGPSRLPLKALSGPSVPRTFMQQAAQAAMRQAIVESFPKHFNNALAGQLAMFRRRGSLGTS